MSKTIMIVQDDQLHHGLYEVIRESTHHRIIRGYHGNDSLIKLGDNKPDLIVLDISFVEGMQGITFFLYLRSKQEYVNIPVIIATHDINRTYESLSKIYPNLVILDRTVRDETLIMAIEDKMGNRNLAQSRNFHYAEESFLLESCI